MDELLKITHLEDRNNDNAFWQTQSDLEKPAAIEVLRQQHINFKQDVPTGLQIVYKIINQTQR